ncbi:CPBP family intramembrane metalloprotease [Peptacetobacter hiranonis]|uniref:CPBP family intramembrane glutamic endopeptidase n=1 Tax=Peptacetobacter hiranonis TaxID=89152 RepID=UPI001917668E|nr:type II CAAX endopeptidase family protein [Peptacetobacter hiranonis]MEE0247242.1 type II CAAX endopeptidase family protein [Peptacetobacter hiranonis]QQQ86532.1 CPBP family intramembrane metalloprotease [Peptacetobacter hiranonis]
MKEFFNKKNIYFILRLLVINMILVFITFFLISIASSLFHDKDGITSDYIITLVTVIALVFVSKYILQVGYSFEKFKEDIKKSKINFIRNFTYSLFVMFIVGIALTSIEEITFLMGKKTIDEIFSIEPTIDILIGTIIFAPFIEELFFRRSIYIYIMENMKDDRFNKYIFLIFSTLTFASLHPPMHKIIFVIPIGLGLSVIYLYTKNFVYTWLMHFIYNFTVIFDITKFELNIYNKLAIISTEEVLKIYSLVRFTIIMFVMLVCFVAINKFCNKKTNKI